MRRSSSPTSRSRSRRRTCSAMPRSASPGSRSGPTPWPPPSPPSRPAGSPRSTMTRPRCSPSSPRCRARVSPPLLLSQHRLCGYDDSEWGRRPTPENLHLARCCALGRHVALGFYFAALLEARRRRACARARWWEALPERSPLQPLLVTGICIHIYMPFDLTENFRVRKKSMVKSRVPLDRSRSDR